MHLITDLDIGGAEMMLYKLLSGLNRDKFEGHVISLTGVGHIGEKIQGLGIPISSLEVIRGLPSLLNLLVFFKKIRQNRPDVIHTWLYHSDFLGVVASILLGRPKLVWNIRCSKVPFNDYRPVTGLIVRLCSHLSTVPDAIIVNSGAGMIEHEQLGYFTGRMHLIPNGFDLERFRPDPEARSSVCDELDLPIDAMIIGLVARWDPLKDHSTFIRAAAQIAQGHENTYFCLVGNGITYETQELLSLITASGLQQRIKLLGPREDIPRLTAAFDIACSSSITEGFSTTLGEAMACGVPCVATDVGDAAAIIGETGRVVPPGNVPAFASACREFIEMGPVRRQELGRKARELIARNYALPDVVREYEILYTNLVSKGSEARSRRAS